jgi:DNA recombination protein RmuC
MQTETYWAIFAIALVAGVAGWVLVTWRHRMITAALVAAAKSASEVELATSRERLRSVEDQAEATLARAKGADEELERVRNELDMAKDEIARLGERASRLPVLEADLQLSRQKCEQAEAAEADLRALTSGELNRLNAELAGQTDRAATLLSERDAARASRANADHEIGDLRAENGRYTAALEAANESVTRLVGEASRLRDEQVNTRAQLDAASQELTDLRARSEKDRESMEQQMQLLMDAKTALTEQFKILASDIFDEKSKRLTEQNQTSLSGLLEPLRLKIGEFQGKVEEVYVQESKDRSALQEQVRNLVSLNQTLSDDAKNLTMALKGSSKAQGNWGEMILERVLELSGLRKGIEYVAQASQMREDGSRAMPDVVINLPEERRLVIDAKVSLVAYERYVAAADDVARAAASKAHIDSVRAHIRGLSGKEYQSLHGAQSLDFVIAFVPIEPAFMLAVTDDSNLFHEAWDRNVLLVSPSTLLFVVRTVAHLWRQEAQTRNAQSIAQRGAELYDKFVGFVDDLENVGTRLDQARDAYGKAHSKLTTGRGNVIRQAELLRGMGVKTSKVLPAPLVAASSALDSDDEPQLLTMPAEA